MVMDDYYDNSDGGIYELVGRWDASAEPPPVWLGEAVRYSHRRVRRERGVLRLWIAVCVLAVVVIAVWFWSDGPDRRR